MVSYPTATDRLSLSLCSGDGDAAVQAPPSLISCNPQEVQICRESELFEDDNDSIHQSWRCPAVSGRERRHSEHERERGQGPDSCFTTSICTSQSRLSQDIVQEQIDSFLGAFDNIHCEQRGGQRRLRKAPEAGREAIQYAPGCQGLGLSGIEWPLCEVHPTQATGLDCVDNQDEVRGGGMGKLPSEEQKGETAFALDGTQETPTSQETAQAGTPNGPKTDTGGRKAASSLSVADRILGFERRGTHSELPKPVKRHRHSKAVYDEDAAEESPGKEKESLPIVFPLHVKKFQRRDSKAAAMIQKPDTPLYRSQPDEDPTIHHPAPQRSIPALRTPPGTPLPVEAAVGVAKTTLQQANQQAGLEKSALEQASKQTECPSDVKAEPETLSSQTSQLRRPKSNIIAERQRELEALAAKNATAGPLQRSNTQPKGKDSQAAIPTSRINPFAHFHGTRGYCVRHGRKAGQGSLQGARSTKDMFDRGRNDDTQSNADACPDCLAELNIKKKELVDRGDFGRESLIAKEFRGSGGEKKQEDEPALTAAQETPSVSKQAHQEPVVPHEDEDAKAAEHQSVQVIDHGKSDIGNSGVMPIEGGPAATKGHQETSQHKDEAPKAEGHEPLHTIDYGNTGINHAGQSSVERAPTPAQAQDHNQSSLRAPNPSRHRSWDSTDVEPSMSIRQAASPNLPSPAKSRTDSHSSTYAASENNVAPTPDHQPRAVHFRALSTSNDHDQNHDFDVVVQRDLGEGLDAMILERGGRLERVVMNSRKGGPTAEVMARLARELSQVSSTISTTNPQRRRDKEYTDGSLDEIIARRKSVPELEHLLRDAADAQDVKMHAHLHPQADGSVEPIGSRRFAGECLVEEEEDEDDVADDAIEDFLQRTPSDIERMAMRQSIEDDYRALRELLDSAAASVDNDYKPHPTGLGYRWPTPEQCRRSLSFPTSAMRKNPNLGSRTLPIMVEDERQRDFTCVLPDKGTPDLTICKSPSTLGLPRLPSQILRAQDMTSPSPEMPPSPNNSALPSPKTPPTVVGPGLTAVMETGSTIRIPTPMPPPLASPQPLGSPSQVQADSQVIRQVMRMEKNKAVQEAAAVERSARRARVVKREVERALQ